MFPITNSVSATLHTDIHTNLFCIKRFLQAKVVDKKSYLSTYLSICHHFNGQISTWTGLAGFIQAKVDGSGIDNWWLKLQTNHHQQTNTQRTLIGGGKAVKLVP